MIKTVTSLSAASLSRRKTSFIAELRPINCSNLCSAATCFSKMLIFSLARNAAVISMKVPTAPAVLPSASISRRTLPWMYSSRPFLDMSLQSWLHVSVSAGHLGFQHFSQSREALAVLAFQDFAWLANDFRA